MGEGTGALIAKLLLQNLFWVAGMGALLCAGRRHAALAGGVGLSRHHRDHRASACGLWLAKTDPALLAERMRPVMQAGPARRRQEIHAGVRSRVAGRGSSRWGWTGASMPPTCRRRCRRSALRCTSLSTGFIMWVLRENSFAAPVVKVQAERGHHVVSTGPYALVRHPMYSGIVLFFIGVPLLLGSGGAPDRAGVRRAVCHSHRDRGTHAGRRPARLC